LSKETIANVFGVEVFRETIAGNILVGCYCVLSNKGGLVSARYILLNTKVIDEFYVGSMI